MKLSSLLTVNAILALAFGIAFALYGPLMLAFFNVPEIESDNTILYWMVASFARIFGAALFGAGLVIWSLRSPTLLSAISEEARRGITFALLLGNAMCTFVAVTQQFSFCQSSAGWVTIAIFSLLTAAYAYFLVRGQNEG